MKNRKQFSDFVYRFIILVIKFIFYINGGLQVKGIANVPAEGGVIIAPNHTSYIDPPLIGAVLPKRSTFMARKELFKIPLIGSFIKLFALPVDREKPHHSTIKKVITILKNGGLFVIFPEGQRSENGKLLQGKRGIGMIAHLSNAAIVPTLIIGSDKALPVDARWLKRTKISIIFDTPIYLSEINHDGDNPSENITKTIMLKIGELKKRYADNCS